MRTRAPARPTPSVVKILVLKVVPAAHDLLARRPHQYGVLVLRHIRALDVTQRRVGLDDADVAEVFEGAQVLLLRRAGRPVHRWSGPRRRTPAKETRRTRRATT